MTNPFPRQRSRSLRILCYAAVDCTHAGGVQRMVGSLSESLGKSGHTVATVWSEPANCSEEGKTICRLHARDAGTATFLPARRSHIPSVVRAGRLLARLRPDLVNVHFATRAAHNFVVLRKLFGYRLALSLHGSDVLRPGLRDSAYLPSLLSGSDGVTAVSGAVRDEALRRSGGTTPIAVIPNGIDTQFWSPRGQVAEHRGPMRLVSVGRLETVKGYDVLIAALNQLHRRGMAVHLTLIGSGSQEAALRKQAAQLGLNAWVEFAGSLQPTEVRAHLYAADVFVLSSRSEGMPLGLMEAMACGLPCVATRVGGVEEIAEGIVPLVPSSDPDALANTVELLLAHPDRARELGDAGVSRMRGYSVDTTHLAYERYFRELVR